MIASGVIHEPPCLRLVGIAKHPDADLTIVDAVLTFVDENKSPGRAGILHIAHFLINSKSLPKPMSIGRIKPRIHRDAAHPGIDYAIQLNCAGIGWTFQNLRVFTAILPQGTLGAVLVDIPIAAVASVEIKVARHQWVGSKS